jgi:hypothetical protein
MDRVSLPIHSGQQTLRTVQITVTAVSWAQRIQNYCCTKYMGIFFFTLFECWLASAEMCRNVAKCGEMKFGLILYLQRK